MNKVSILAVMAFLAAAVPPQAMAQTQQQPPNASQYPEYYWHGPGRMMWGGGWDGGYGGTLWEMIPMFVLLTVLVCIVLFYFARGPFAGGPHSWSTSPQGWDDPSRSALQILNERFAKGEIQKAEYEEKKGAIFAGTKR